MKSQQYIVNPKTSEQVSALKALLKTHKIEFEVIESTFSNPDSTSEVQESKENYKIIEKRGKSAKDDVAKNLKTGLKEVRLFKKGKLKTTSAKDFLNEI